METVTIICLTSAVAGGVASGLQTRCQLQSVLRVELSNLSAESTWKERRICLLSHYCHSTFAIFVPKSSSITERAAIIGLGDLGDLHGTTHCSEDQGETRMMYIS